MATGTDVLNFGAFPGASDASTVVTGQPGIVAGSLVEAWVRPVATADHSADEHVLESLEVSAGNIVPGTGFTIYGVNRSLEGVGDVKDGQGRTLPQGGNTRLYGQFAVSWAWA